MKLKKGSKAAKEYMASIRKMKKTSTKKVGAIKIVEKGESKNAKPSAVYQYNRTKKGTFKGLKKIGATKSSTHKDTKSHNVNVKVVSGIESEYKKTKAPISISISRTTGRKIIKWRGTEKIGHLIENKYVFITRRLTQSQIHSLGVFLEKNNLKLAQ